MPLLTSTAIALACAAANPCAEADALRAAGRVARTLTLSASVLPDPGDGRGAGLFARLACG